MESINVELIAGMMSTMIFIFSNLPMIAKALTTKNLKSYSLGQIGLANMGNLIHWVYIIGLPMGPIWFLHGFNTAVAVIMLICYVRYEIGWSRVQNWLFAQTFSFQAKN
jgi:hypothetical protein